jgi:hypothetical protein
MSPRLAAREGGASASMIAGLVVVVLAAGMFLLFNARGEVERFDPGSGSATGTRGLVVLLERQGATVDVTGDVPQDPAANQRLFVIDDTLTQDQRTAVEAFAAAGGVVVVADPESTLNGVPEGRRNRSGRFRFDSGRTLSEQINLRPGTCNIDALAHIRGLSVEDDMEFRVERDSQRCFGSAALSFVVVRTVGNGLIVGLGDNDLFTNGELRFADNAVLATALLAPTPDSRVVYLRGDASAATVERLEEGDRTLSDLVRPGVWMALLQLAIAFVVFAVATAIRPGRPVRETRPVPLAGSGGVAARANLMQRARHSVHATELLMTETHRDLCRYARLPTSTPLVEVDRAVCERIGVPPGAVVAALTRNVHDDRAMVQRAVLLADLRRRLVDQSDTSPAVSHVAASPIAPSETVPATSGDVHV